MSMKNRIMFGVYLVYLIRKFKTPFIAESFVFAAFALLLSVFVSVPSVLSNMMSSPDFYRYIIIAFSNTTLMVQLIVVLSLIVTVKAVIDWSHLSSVGRARLS